MARLHATTLGLAIWILGAASAAAADDIARLSWLAGCWSGTQGEVTTEEHWTSPAGGEMVGMNKAVAGGRVVFFEFLRIAPQEGRLCYLASPRGGAVTPFCATTVGEQRVVFENREHDFPQRIIYERHDGGLRARTEGTVDGKERSESWEWGRCAG
jgi:hypothetical protein